MDRPKDRFGFHRLVVKAGAPLLSIGLMFLSIILLRGEIWAAGTITLLLAMAGTIYSIRSVEKAPFSLEDINQLRPLVRPGLAWGAVVILSLFAVYNITDHFQSPLTNRLAVATWVASVVAGLAMVWGKTLRSLKAEALLNRLLAHRIELGILFLIFIVALDLRAIGLSVHPYPWSGDEASIGMEARRILNGEITNFFETGWSIQPNWSFVPTAITEFVFGDTIFAVRLVSALAGTLAVLFVYLAGRELFNREVGLMASAFLATLPYHLHFSRIGVNNIMDSMLSSLTFWLLVRGLKREDIRYLYAAGAIAGLSIYTYAGTRLVLILSGVFLLFYLLRVKDYWRTHMRLPLAFAAGAAISLAGQMAFFFRNWNIFMGRFGQEGIFLNGWIQHHQAQTGKSVLQILADQFTGNTLIYIARPAFNNFFNSTQPYLTIVASVLFLLGMAYAFAYLRQPEHFVLLTWFWAVILFGGVLTLNPPAHTRLLMTTPAMSLFMALGLYKLVEYLKKARLDLGRLALPVFVLIVAVISFQNITYYMFRYRTEYRFQDANGEAAMEIGASAAQLGPEYNIYVMGDPRFYASFPTITFVAPKNQRFDIYSGNIATFELQRGQKAAFYASPENFFLLEQIKQKYPGGKNGSIYRKSNPGELLLEIYILNQ